MPVLSRAPTDDDVAATLAAHSKRFHDTLEGADLQGTRPTRDWYLWAYGPHGWAYGGRTDVIVVGEYFYVIVGFWFNPWSTDPYRPSACEYVTSMACDCKIEICTMDVCRVKQGPPELNITRSVTLNRGQCYYEELFWWQAQPGWEGLYDMNITAVITGCNNKTTPFAGFADNVIDVVPDMFGNPSGMPTKFLITAP